MSNLSRSPTLLLLSTLLFDLPESTCVEFVRYACHNTGTISSVIVPSCSPAMLHATQDGLGILYNLHYDKENKNHTLQNIRFVFI